MRTASVVLSAAFRVFGNLHVATLSPPFTVHTVRALFAAQLTYCAMIGGCEEDEWSGEIEADHPFPLSLSSPLLPSLSFSLYLL
jgi:hypothetical protein